MDKQGRVKNTVKSGSALVSPPLPLSSAPQAENLSCPSGTASSGIRDAGSGMHRTASATRAALAATAAPATASLVSSWKKTCSGDFVGPRDAMKTPQHIPQTVLQKYLTFV